MKVKRGCAGRAHPLFDRQRADVFYKRPPSLAKPSELIEIRLAASVVAESATAAEKQDNPQTIVVSAAIAAKCVSASAAADKKQDDPQAGRHAVSVVASTSAVCSS